MRNSIILNQESFLDTLLWRLNFVHSDLKVMKKVYGDCSLDNDIKEIKLLISLAKHYKENCDQFYEASMLNSFITNHRLLQKF